MGRTQLMPERRDEEKEPNKGNRREVTDSGKGRDYDGSKRNGEGKKYQTMGT